MNEGELRMSRPSPELQECRGPKRETKGALLRAHTAKSPEPPKGEGLSAGGFLVSAQTGAISLMNNGYAPANRTATGATVRLNAWNEFAYRCDVSNGEGKLLVNGAVVATHNTMLLGSVYASNLFATTDSSPGMSNAFGFFDDLSIGTDRGGEHRART